MRLFPSFGALATAAGRASWLMPPFSLAPGVTAAPSYPDLVAALVARLRAQGVGASLGEAGGVKKIYADGVMGSPQLPWAEVEEPSGTREYMAGGSYIERGQIEISVHAAGKLQARQLADSAAAALNDAPLTWTGGRLMKFRLRGNLFEKTPGPAPGSPASYHRLLTFDYWSSGSFA